MIQEVDIFLYLVDLRNVLFIQRDQGIHGTVQIFLCQRSHTLQLLDYFYHCCGGVEHHFVSNIFQLIALSVTHLLVLAGYDQVSHLHLPAGEREQHDYLCNLDQRMCICYESAIVRRDGLDQFHNLVSCHKQGNVDDHCTDDIEQQMNMKNEPQVVNLLMSLKNPFLATLMGFALTAIIQSSSVTVSIVLLLANQDMMPLPIICILSWDVISVPVLPQC